MGEYVRISYDNGITWSKDYCLASVSHWDHGYPTSVELENGDIFTTYYAPCDGDDYNSVHSVRWNLNELK